MLRINNNDTFIILNMYSQVSANSELYNNTYTITQNEQVLNLTITLDGKFESN